MKWQFVVDMSAFMNRACQQMLVSLAVGKYQHFCLAKLRLAGKSGVCVPQKQTYGEIVRKVMVTVRICNENFEVN